MSPDIQQELESMYNDGHLRGELICTGRLFTTNGQQEGEDHFLSKQNPEFEFNGDRYVRVTVLSADTCTVYEDGSLVPLSGAVE